MWLHLEESPYSAADLRMEQSELWIFLRVLHQRPQYCCHGASMSSSCNTEVFSDLQHALHCAYHHPLMTSFDGFFFLFCATSVHGQPCKCAFISRCLLKSTCRSEIWMSYSYLSKQKAPSRLRTEVKPCQNLCVDRNCPHVNTDSDPSAHHFELEFLSLWASSCQIQEYHFILNRQKLNEIQDESQRSLYKMTTIHFTGIAIILQDSNNHWSEKVSIIIQNGNHYTRWHLGHKMTLISTKIDNQLLHRITINCCTGW